jgi:hypothetical protein
MDSEVAEHLKSLDMIRLEALLKIEGPIGNETLILEEPIQSMEGWKISTSYCLSD